MFSRKATRMPLIFHVNGIIKQSYDDSSLPLPTTPSTSSLPIKRFAMFQNLQNTKPCGSCGGR
jgi:hypothetical protein